MIQELLPPFLPQHEDAEIILERIVKNLPSQVFDKMYYTIYAMGGYGPQDYEKIHEMCGHTAAGLLSMMRGEEIEYLPLPF